jgi:hypothetical protein
MVAMLVPVSFEILLLKGGPTWPSPTSLQVKNMITELTRLSEILPALTQDLGWPS